MGANSKIEWTHHTANTWWGCTKVSDGCKHCYAETFSKRTGHDVWGPNASRRQMKGVWSEVVKWAKEAAAAGERRRVFWGSMMDVCEDRPELVEPRKRFCGLVEQLEDLDFLILTKRPENYNRLMPWTTWPKNAWAGTSTENQLLADARVDSLRDVNASIRWLSAEPLLSELKIRCGVFGWVNRGPSVADAFDACFGKNDAYSGGKPLEPMPNLIHWVIVGGESGNGARPSNVEWIRQIVQQCKAAAVPVFVKQLGAKPFFEKHTEVNESSPNHVLHFQQHEKRHYSLENAKGGDWGEWTGELADLRVREFPATPAAVR